MKNLLLGTCLLALCACNASPIDNGSTDASADSAALHGRILTLDTHVDIPLTYMLEIDPASETKLQVDLGKLTAGGLDAAFFIVYTPQGELTEDGYRAGLQIAQTRVNAIRAMTDQYKDKIELALTSDDVRRIDASGRRAALIGMENAYPLGDSVDDIAQWEKLGIRYVGITHFGHNQFGDSSNPNPERDTDALHNGLSPLGRNLINALNDAGILVDVSHAGKATMMQAADLSRAPIIASHSGVKAIGYNARNLDDEQLLKIKAVGGVAQMVALGAYVKPHNQAQLDAAQTLRDEMGIQTGADIQDMSEEKRTQYYTALKDRMYAIEPAATVADFVDHIDHAVKIAGIDHVGIASDFDGGGGITGWQDASETQNITAELVKRGYSETEIEKIWGGNLLRVLDATQAQKKSQ